MRYNEKRTASVYDALTVLEQRAFDGVSQRGADWLAFAAEVLAHIEEYTVPQYGDAGEDNASEYTTADMIGQIKKYATRHGRNARAGQDRLDAMKMAHYAQMLANKLK